MKYKVKMNLDYSKFKTESDFAEVVKSQVVPNVTKEMRRILFSEKTPGPSGWGEFRDGKAGLFIRSAMEYLQKTKAIDETSSFVIYTMGHPNDIVSLRVYLGEEAEGIEGESPEYIMKSLLAFDERMAQQIFDRVVSQNFER